MNPNPRRPDPVASALVSIRRLVRVLRLDAQRTQRGAGVTAAQLFVLEQLGEANDLSMNDLAERTFTDRSSVADVVERLAEAGLVDRRPDPDDRRRAVVRLTAAGARLLKRAPDAPTTALIAAIRRLSLRDRKALATSLERLNDALGAANVPATMLFADDAPPPARRKPRKR